MQENNIKTHWDHYALTIQTNSKPVELFWTDVESLAFYSALQTGLYGGQSTILSKQLFFEKFPNWAKMQWHHHESLTGSFYKDGETILDIGSGIGVVDLIQAKIHPNSKFILVDKEVQEFQHGVYFSQNYPFYNSWGATKDCLRSSNISNNFSFQLPDDPWGEVDHIISYFSWCFHYPKSVYWDQVLNSLKVGGTLVLDVRLTEQEDTIGEISEALKFIPYKDAIPNTIPNHIDNYPSPNPEVMGYRCIWKKCC